MDFRKQFTRTSSLMVYLALALMLAGWGASGSARYALRTAGCALLAGATMYVIVDARKREARLCVARKNKVAN